MHLHTVFYNRFGILRQGLNDFQNGEGRRKKCFKSAFILIYDEEGIWEVKRWTANREGKARRKGHGAFGWGESSGGFLWGVCSLWAADA